MGKLFKFQKSNEHECEECGDTEDTVLVYEAEDFDPLEVVANFADLVLEAEDAEDAEEVFNVLLRLYNTARKIGYKDALELDVAMKLDTLGDIAGSICTCGKCD